MGYDDRSIRLIGPPEGTMLLEGFLHMVATRPDVRLPSAASQLQGSTLLLYLKAAALWLQTELNVTVHVVSPTTQKILPPFRDVIAQAFKWGTPQPKREPYTHQMLKTFYRQVHDLVQKNPAYLLSLFAAVFDWVRLGLFTGSRGNEYCQTVARRHEVTRVPLDAAAGEHAGEPIAFIMTDFRFLTADDTILSPESSLRHPHSVVELQIRFRFDKSPINSRWRKFRRTGHGYLCPVLAGLSIVQRAVQLQVRPTDPLGVYGWPGRLSLYTFIRSTEVISIMRKLVLDAHPDPNHYLRRPDRIKCIDCHSTRVTACVALSEGGASADQIAHKLRWSVESVKHYMRDCSRTVGASTAKVIQGFFHV